MKWPTLLSLIGSEPVFTSALLLAGTDVSLAQVRLQLARWARSGRLLQLRRGIYVLAHPYRKVEPHPFFIANQLKAGSYVSLQAALAYYGLIPEFAAMVTSVCTGRPEIVETPLGTHVFKHVSSNLFQGYQQVQVAKGQDAFIATPEKALLDLLYLTPGSDSPEFLQELRLQNIETIDPVKLREWVDRLAKPKLQRAVQKILELRATMEGETV